MNAQTCDRSKPKTTKTTTYEVLGSALPVLDRVLATIQDEFPSNRYCKRERASKSNRLLKQVGLILIVFWIINNFLVEAYQFIEDDDLPSLIIITTRDWASYQPSEGKDAPYSKLPRTQEFETPFSGMSPLEVANVLREEATFPPYNTERSGGDAAVSTEYCVILDNPTLNDGKTALLVRTRRELGENLPGELDKSSIVEYRMNWEDVDQSLSAWSIGSGSMEELLWNDPH